MIVLYGITVVPLVEDLRDANPTLLYPFYAYDAAFDGSVRRSAVQLQLMKERGLDRGYSEPDKSLSIADNPENEEAARQEFELAGLNLDYVGGSQYPVAYLGPREELEECVRPKIKEWDHGVCTLDKAIPPVGIYCLWDVTPDRVAVPANDFPWCWHYNRSYRGCPKRGILPFSFWRRGGHHQPQRNPRP